MTTATSPDRGSGGGVSGAAAAAGAAAPVGLATARERVVIYRLGSLGDTVVALPCLHRIAETFPRAERIALTNFPVSAKAAPLDAIVGGSGLIHRAVAYPVGLRSLRGLWRLAADLRRLDATTLVYLTPSRGLAAAWRDVAFFRLSGFRRIVGAPLSADLQRSRQRSDGSFEWECQRLARCVAALGPIDLEDRRLWDLRLGDEERAAAETLLAPIAGRPWMAINMGGKAAANDWGVANWLSLVERLGRDCADHALLFVGAAEDAARAAEVGRSWPGSVLNACGSVPPRVSAAAMAGARLFVGHDSGPLHLAACMGVRCVGLYGNNNAPRKWHPYGPGHFVIHRMDGVMTISVDEVAAAVTALLGATAPHAA